MRAGTPRYQEGGAVPVSGVVLVRIPEMALILFRSGSVCASITITVSLLRTLK